MNNNVKPFYCPTGVNIAWHLGLIYTECPLNLAERDYSECTYCPLKNTRLGFVPKENLFKKSKKEHKDNDMKVRISTSMSGTASVELDSKNNHK